MLSAVAIRATAASLNACVKLRRFFLGTLVLLVEQCVLFPCLSSGVHSNTLGDKRVRQRFRRPISGWLAVSQFEFDEETEVPMDSLTHPCLSPRFPARYVGVATFPVSKTLPGKLQRCHLKKVPFQGSH